VGIRSLTNEQAAAGQPVRLRGVNLVNEYAGFILHDGQAGIYVGYKHAYLPEVGQELVVDGVSAAGATTPIVQAAKWSVHSPGPELAPVHVSEGVDLRQASFDCQWIEFEGVVRVAMPAPAAFTLYPSYAIVAFGKDRLQVSFVEYRSSNCAPMWARGCACAPLVSNTLIHAVRSSRRV
jgi:hypothetical protein